MNDDLTRDVSRQAGAAGEDAVEQERLKALHALGILDTQDEPALDALTDALRMILDLPIAVVALIDTDRVILKAGKGSRDRREVPRDLSFCTHVIAYGKPVVVCDATEDPRFSHNPYVAGPEDNYVFYVGIPLTTSAGVVVGTLCGFDRRPRGAPDEAQIETLCKLAVAAVSALELKSSEAALRRSEQVLLHKTELLQTTLEAIGQGITAFDRDLRLVAWNHTALDILDIPVEFAHVGAEYRSFARLMAKRGLYGPGDPDAQVEARVAAMQQFVPYQAEYTFPNGRIITIQGTPLSNGGFLTTYTDVTEERRRAKDLADQARQHALQGRIAVIANEAADVRTALTRVIAEFCDVIGYEVGHAYRQTSGDGLTSTGVLHIRGSVPEPAGEVEPQLAALRSASRLARQVAETGEAPFASGNLEVGDLGNICAMDHLTAGLAFPVHVLSETYVVECYGTHALGPKPWHPALRAHLDAQLARVAERERVERLKNEFVSTVSHELRTPLTSIAGMLELLESGLFGEFSIEVKGMLAVALANSRRLGQLIEDILDIERIEQDMLPLDVKPLALAPLVEQAVGLLAPVGDAAVPIEIRQGLEGIAAMVDPGRFRQILDNLLSNAVKFSPPGQPVSVTIAPQGDWIRTSVVDRGSGIPESFQPRIFEKFAQADSSDTRRIPGTGLGLAIAKQLADKLGGRISFETVAGRGTAFHLDLPPAPLTSRAA